MRILFFLLFVPPLWLSVHVVRKRSWHPLFRAFLVLLLILISQKYTINAFFFGSLAGPDMPEWVLLTQAFALILLVLVFFCVAVSDAAGLFARFFRGRNTAVDRGRRSFLSGMGWGVPLLIPLSGAAALGVHEGIAVPRVFHTSRVFSFLPPGLDGLRIAHLSDIHIGPLTSLAWMEQVTELVAREKPDLVCITGDLADGLPGYDAPGGGRRADVALMMKKLSAPLGVYACTGNHEYYSDYSGWMAIYREAGISFLHDTAMILNRNGTELVLAGRNDPQCKLISGVSQTCSSVFQGFPWRKDSAFRLLLDHRPNRAPANAPFCDLQLSGHTHGGHCLFMDRLVARANKGFVRGWYEVAGMPLFITSGVGLWSGFPVRIGIPAEIACITLRAA
ncbi:MAG: metallophosphoesterase [Desulfovibrio sp.]|nr:metallophosphoesterase [Desulfovibrio sp.]